MATGKRALAALQRYFVPLALLFYLAGFTRSIRNLLVDGTLDNLDWALAAYHVNYVDFGFAKRAVLGTLYRPFLAPFEDGGMGERLVIMAGDFLCVGLLLYLVARALRRAGPVAHGPLGHTLRAAIVCAPVGMAQIGFELGRTDHYNYLLLALALAAVARGHLVAAALVCGAAVLLHEAFFFYGLPAVMLAAALRDGHARAAALALPAILAMAAVALYGNLEPQALARLDPAVSAGATDVWQRGVWEPARAIPPAMVALALLLTLAPLAFTLAVLHQNRALGPAALLLAAPLALFLLGIDYFRWAHLAFVMCTALLLHLALAGRVTGLRLNRTAILAIALYCLPLGAVGVAEGYPHLAMVLGR